MSFTDVCSLSSILYWAVRVDAEERRLEDNNLTYEVMVTIFQMGLDKLSIILLANGCLNKPCRRFSIFICVSRV
jgi:hypothetical protein